MVQNESKKCESVNYLGRIVDVEIDRPLGSAHPKYGFIYEVNYGFISGTISGDGEELDAYVLGVDNPLKTFNGRVIAIVHRTDEDDDKLVVVPDGLNFTNYQIELLVNFQEKWKRHIILR